MKMNHVVVALCLLLILALPVSAKKILDKATIRIEATIPPMQRLEHESAMASFEYTGGSPLLKDAFQVKIASNVPWVLDVDVASSSLSPTVVAATLVPLYDGGVPRTVPVVGGRIAVQEIGSYRVSLDISVPSGLPKGTYPLYYAVNLASM
ncbi:MAG: hypothetical protein GX980_00465 [Firmicutes bacterium]|jgi:hypothetical protein|nr:hypothetical protein [Bacillota bacterium]